MSVRSISFNSIPVTNQDRALEFYTTHLGFDVAVDAPYQGDWRWIFLSLPDTDTKLHFAQADELAWKEGLPVLSLLCDSVDRLAYEFDENGVQIVNGPDEAPWKPGTRWLLIHDSEGNLIILESQS